MKYRKKPVVVEAIQFTGYNGLEVIDWIKACAPDIKEPIFHWNKDADDENLYTLTIHTLEGDMLASAGDFIICGVHGEFYPCKPDIFDKTYEPAE